MRCFGHDLFGYWLLATGCWLLRTPTACRHSFSGGASFSVGVLVCISLYLCTSY